MPVGEAPNDDDVRQSYNFAPGYHGLVYRANGPEPGSHKEQEHENEEVTKREGEIDTKYKLQAMQWGRYRKLLLRDLADAGSLRSCAVLDEAQS